MYHAHIHCTYNIQHTKWLKIKYPQQKSSIFTTGKDLKQNFHILTWNDRISQKCHLAILFISKVVAFQNDVQFLKFTNTWHKTAPNLPARMSGYQTLLTSILWISMCGEPCYNGTTSFSPNRKKLTLTLPSFE